ncbi:MAG TPA: UDP-4-amino-4,6-dideoxy-N-acetyl-beta-L-altrosamine transaminase [Verrucomicrobia bacterium]|nr:UDP-4-amino-4,6-dideoxy-N-acetyl-beta-L-altrosamine transaminase [Verrucomicrobiota bacterium]
MKTIPYGRHEITEADIESVVAALRSDFLTQGPRIAEFEAAFAAYIGVPHAVAVSNGTAALHLCAMAMNVQPGQKVITTPITFAATANCIRYAGGDVVFADIDPDTYLLDPLRVKAVLDAAPRGTYGGIIPVDFSGQAVDMETFKSLANAHGCWLIEDACHAPGGFFTDSSGTVQRCGNGAFAEAAIFSFHPVKHIAAGEGGMITTARRDIADRLRNLRCHGIQQDPAKRLENHGGWYYEMQELGYNYRLTDIQAALAISQLKRADGNLARRRLLAERYREAFAGKPFLIRPPAPLDGHACHLFVAEFDRRDALYQHLRAHGIFAQVHYIPLHLMPYYRDLGWCKGDLPNAETYYQHALSLPLFPSLTDLEQNHVIHTTNQFYN